MIDNSANQSGLITSTFPALTIVSTVGLTRRIFAILITASVRAAPFAPIIDQGATAAIAAIVILVVVVVVVVVIAAGDEE